MGGGRKKRTLAHGYSMSTLSGLRADRPDILTPRVQLRMWDTLNSFEEGATKNPNHEFWKYFLKPDAWHPTLSFPRCRLTTVAFAGGPAYVIVHAGARFCNGGECP